MPSPAAPAYNNASFVKLLEANSGKNDVLVTIHAIFATTVRYNCLIRRGVPERLLASQVRSMWAMSNDFDAGLSNTRHLRYEIHHFGGGLD